MTFAPLQVWGDEAAIKAMPIKQQAFLTAALLGLLQQADGSGGVEGTPGLTGALLSGISARLSNPIESLRCATVAQHRAATAPSKMCWCSLRAACPERPIQYVSCESQLRSLLAYMRDSCKHCSAREEASERFRTACLENLIRARKSLSWCQAAARPLPEQLKSRSAKTWPYAAFSQSFLLDRCRLQVHLNTLLPCRGAAESKTPLFSPQDVGALVLSSYSAAWGAAGPHAVTAGMTGTSAVLHAGAMACTAHMRELCRMR